MDWIWNFIKFILLRIFLSQGWYIICYALGIYLLNLFLAFLTPKFDPSLEQELKNESIEEGLDQEDQFHNNQIKNMMMMMMMSLDHL